MSDPEATVLAAVDRLDIPYEVIQIDPDYADTAAFCVKYGYPPEQSANTIVVAAKRGPEKYAVCVVQATTRLDVNKRVRELMGVSRLSFASAEQMAGLTGMLEGGVTPFALPDGIPIYVDDRIMANDWIILGSGGRASKIKISPDVFRKLPGAEVVKDLAVEPPSQ